METKNQAEVTNKATEISSSADGTAVKTFFNKTILTVASVAGSAGLLTGLYIASKKTNPTVWTYVGHAVLGLVAGGAAGGIVTKIFGGGETSGADGSTQRSKCPDGYYYTTNAKGKGSCEKQPVINSLK